MKQSIVEVKNIWAEDLFKWFYEHVVDSGGDGASCIVCDNYKEVADDFVCWYKTEYRRDEFYHEKDVYGNIINFHDSNENFMFSDTIPKLHTGDYVFIVVEDCLYGLSNYDRRIIKYRG